MGMFDTIKVEVDIPGYNGPMDDFQTKDLDRAMEGYTINKEGKLIHHTTELVPVSEEEKQHVFHLYNTIPAGDEDTEFHGMLNFYTYDRERDCMEEFDAKFTDGYLVEMCNTNTGATYTYDFGK